MKHWDIDSASELYQINSWGGGFFCINDAGRVDVIAKRNNDTEHRLDLADLCHTLRQRNLHPPLLLRFSDVLKQRMQQLHQHFANAIADASYQGDYFGIYPIKVNQQRQVLEEITEFGAEYNWGLEAGSKPEMHAILAMLEEINGIIICNGYKDEAFIELALIACKLGKRVFIVIEKLNELHTTLQVAERLNVKPLIGLRCRLSANGVGMWADSGGDKSKFGLSANKILEAVAILKQHNKLDCLQLIHSHIGSQVSQIQYIKKAMQESARFYVELRQLGAPLQFIDIGGGLGINYDGSISGKPTSIDYSLQEYANNVVWAIRDVCDATAVPHPHILSESGRALVAHHSVLILDVLDSSCKQRKQLLTATECQSSTILKALWRSLQSLPTATTDEIREVLNDAIELRNDIKKMFLLGHCSLQERADTDALYWEIISKINDNLINKDILEGYLPNISQDMADRYFCNFSIFQSLPDAWAIEQVFPVIPLQDLHKKPDRKAILVDITCDSDGKIAKFPLKNGISSTLPVHSLSNTTEPYLLGVFLVGAYQEILGDMHNLFGGTHVVHVRMNDDGQYELEQIITGESVAEALEYVDYNENMLMDRMRRQLQHARDKKRISASEAKSFLASYRQGLASYTYLSK
ncbi:MAG: biosynthetic arginine decarboxylase [Mariprofundales bacterium]